MVRRHVQLELGDCGILQPSHGFIVGNLDASNCLKPPCKNVELARLRGRGPTTVAGRPGRKDSKERLGQGQRNALGEAR